jgi:hypothetical protein
MPKCLAIQHSDQMVCLACERTWDVNDPAPPIPKNFYCRFKDPGSGLIMELGKWYLLSDSGSSYSSIGYADAQSAVRAALALPDHDLKVPDIATPTWVGPPAYWLNDWAACNVLNADHLLAFWRETDPTMLATCAEGRL